MNYKIFIYVLLGIITNISAQMEVVSAGKGSYASQAPENKGTQKLYSINPFVEEESQNKPLPTNDWWTSLLSSKPFPGKLWAYPLTISADSKGPIIWYCKEWNANGTEMRMGEPLRISAIDSSPKGPNADITLFDFEHESWEGWAFDGMGMGNGPMTEKNHKMFKYSGKRYLCSFYAGDPGTGFVESKDFLINRDYINFLIAGGKDEKQLGVYLIINNKVVAQGVGENSVVFKLATWDVKKYKGQKARIRIVDNSRGGWGFIAADHFVLSNTKGMVKSGVFSHASTKNWGDWTVCMRLKAKQKKFFDVTFGRGLPYTWIESQGLGYEINSKIDNYYNLDGKSVNFPFKSDALLVEIDKRIYGLFGPDQTMFSQKNNTLRISTGNKNSFLVAAAIPNLTSAKEIYKYAFAVPRKSEFDWDYKQKEASVSTSWEVETESLKGSNKKVLQGWIPHHWRKTKNNLKFTETAYRTQRGLMRMTLGNTFEISWPFHGILPAFPLPKQHETKRRIYNDNVLSDYLEKWISEKEKKPELQKYRADTYWGGKDFLKLSQVMTIAKQINHPKYESIFKMTKDALSDWLTYTPGEKEHFFAKYQAPWNGIVGFRPSYGSETFTDNHFHYGYTVLASALLGYQDRQWLDDYRDMLTLVARQYANWDRNNDEFPYLRTFDPWGGHSYASGLSSNHDGNNQESSSEAMGSWSGLFLLGDLLDDKKMRACGAMGYAIEAEAVYEYWNDYYGWKYGQESSNYSEKYKHSIVSVLRDRDIGFWTWFSGEPKHIYGIQWLPCWTTMHYLSKDPDFIEYQVKNMLSLQGKGKAYSITDIDRDWGHLTLGYYLWGRPLEVINILESQRKDKKPLGDFQNAGITYYLAHTFSELGRIAPEYNTSLPTSLVFKHEDKLEAVVFNHSLKEQEVSIYKNGREITKITVPANSLHRQIIKP